MRIKCNNKLWSNCYTAIVVSVCSLTATEAMSAPGKISDVPLTLGNKPKPNLLFVIDDSGSMENEVLLRKEAKNIHGDNPKDSTGADNGNLTMSPESDTEYLELCAGYNLLAFNPKNTYSHWPGKQNADLREADSYPAGRDWSNDTGTDYNAGGGGNDGDAPEGRAKLRLTQANIGYTIWNDINGDKKYDAGECEGFKNYSAMNPTEKQNFANWYSYHRKRRFLVTSPLLNVADNVDMRVGFATINNSAEVGRPILDLTEGTNRESLRTSILNLGDSKGTPLRRPLDNAGRYFSGNRVDPGFLGRNAPNPATPILSVDKGGACQQNYTMLMTDGYSTENGNTPITNVGNADADGPGDFDGDPYADAYSNTLGDIAMHYYETDLAPNLDNEVSSNDVNDTNKAQHMVTYAVAFGVTGNLTWPLPPNPAWPDASGNLWNGQKEGSLDDLVHAAFNGRGEFLSALDGETLNESIAKVVANIKSNTAGSGSSVSLSATDIAPDTLLFETGYDGEFWSGELEAFNFSTGKKGNKVFSAGEKLEARIIDAARGATSRVIISHNNTTEKGVPFRFPADHNNPTGDELSAEQVEDLLVNSAAADKQTFGQQIVDYLRGDQSLADGKVFRNRDGKALGDIIESVPQFVGPPSADYPNFIEGVNNPYQTFATRYRRRDEIVYVGSNDGMLHGFDARTGEERLAYIPGQLYSKDKNAGLHYLADTNYKHKPYVDATPTIADVFVDGKWRTYLVGAYGAGGAGVYVLDVTDPNTFSENNAGSIVKFEFTDPQLGFGFSRPQIVKTNNNNKWAAIFGNGYGGNTGDGKAKLFVVYLDGSGHKIIDTTEGSIANMDCLDAASDCNGLSTPTVVDFNRDAKADRVYAGDLHGNMWAFDVSNINEGDWDVAHNSPQNKPAPMFVACTDTLVRSRCAVGKRQPITTKPVVTGQKKVRGVLTRPNTLVLFGTGQLLTADDMEDATVQSFYGVWDAGQENGEKSRAELVQQTLGTTNVGGNANVRSLSTNPVNYSTSVTGKFGWYLDFPKSGERVTVDPILGKEIVLFNTSIPGTGACAGSGGGFLMAAEIFTGGLPNFPVFNGAPDQSGVELPQTVEGNAIIDGTSISQLSDGQQSSNSFDDSRPAKSRRVNWSIIQ